MVEKLASLQRVDDVIPPAKKKRKKTGGKKRSPYEPNKKPLRFQMITSTSAKNAYKNVMRQYHVNSKHLMEKKYGASLPYDIRDIKMEQLKAEGVAEAFATGARMLEGRKAAHGLPARGKGEKMRADGYSSLWNKFCTCWKKAAIGRASPHDHAEIESRVFKEIYKETKYEEIKIPVLPPSRSEMKIIFAHLNKNDSVLNLQRRMLLHLNLFFEARTGNSLRDICFQSFRYEERLGLILYRCQNTKTSKFKKGKLKLVADNPHCDFVFRSYFTLRERCVAKNSKTGLLLRIRPGAEDCLVGEHIGTKFKVFEDKPLPMAFIRTWFHDLAVEAGIKNCDRFKGKSVRQFLAAVEEDIGVNTWKRKSLISTYNLERRKLCGALTSAIDEHVGSDVNVKK